LLHKLKIATAVLLALGTLAAGVGLVALPRLTAQAAPGRPGKAAAPAPKDNAPEKREADEFTRIYALPDGGVLKRVAPPFSPLRMDYYRRGYAHQAELIPDGPVTMYFRWGNAKLTSWGMTFSTSGNGDNLPTIVKTVAGIYPQDIEGDEGLRTQVITGDFVVREGAAPEKVVARLEDILRQECKQPVKLALKEVERKVFVARGRFHYTPLPDHKDNDIELYALQVIPNNGAGGGSGDFAEFLQAAGWFIDRRLVSEVEDAPKGRAVSWRYNRRSPFTEQEGKEDTDPEQVLKHLGEQTGLTFKEETRTVRVLFVERTEK
jgi:hypothetical protein